MTKLFVFNILQILQMMILIAVSQFQEELNCPSLYGEPGQCIGIRQCPELLNLLQMRPLKPETIDLLRQMQCGFDDINPRVCCPIRRTSERLNNNTQNIDDQNVQYNFSNNPLLPTDCGKDLSQRIYGGEITDLDEFPWMVLLEYLTLNGKRTACGGVLISRRYVLTAAHCVKGKDLPRTWQLSSVRLGEYDTSSDRDCVPDDERTVICADDPVTVGIEEQIAHESYQPRSRDQKYDIALLRLSRDVTFTTYIKPICLPPTASLEQKLFVAGWGKTENGSSSNVKLKLVLPLFDKEQCQKTYGNAGVMLGHGQICAGGQKDKDSCKGDSGGPLMTMKRNRDSSGKWIVVGVVSFGPLPCGMLGMPGVYTRVIDFVPWILDKMRS
ncbi:hypothetical protein QLX08_003116 [Tetragonisca angustula]|uniref:CLIP domain-containing serine protease n=1 Tax=Tetragonisca angustula TaxID=166442 RepID=A0AAW1AA79_9HYME